MKDINLIYVPKHIADSDELSQSAKKLLDGLLNYAMNSVAKKTGRIFVSNPCICRISKIKLKELLFAVDELKRYSLIDRIQGTELGSASEYIINFEKLTEPLKRKSFEEFFKELFEKPSITEKPQQEPITTRIEVKILKDE